MIIMKNRQKIMAFAITFLLIISLMAIIGEAGPSIQITKKPDTKKYLKIQSPSKINEGITFNIFVYAEINQTSETCFQPVPNATVNVGWNNFSYFTDINGKVTLTAPLVNNDEIYTITATKTGYYPDEVKILIINIQPRLVIYAPSSVYEGMNFGVEVFAGNQTVSGVTVVFNNESKTTSMNGSVSFTAPMVNENTVFDIFAYKSGYMDAWAFITVLNNLLPQLVIHAPSSVYEGMNFGVEVFAGNQTVSGVTVVFNNESKTTSMNGSVSFTAPPVNESTTFEIYAYKQGYNSATSTILVMPLKS